MKMIHTMSDTDWYILTMAQLFLHKHPTAMGRDAFKCRNPEETLFAKDKPSFVTMPGLINDLDDAIDKFCELRFTPTELQWFGGCNYLKPDFIDWLEDFRPKRRYIKVVPHDDNTFDIRIEGPITQTIWFEVPVLAMISQLYGSVAIDHDEALKNGRKKLQENLDTIFEIATPSGVQIADFGTRRRHSQEWQEEVIHTFLQRYGYILVGTSNVHLARVYDIPPIGTMAHKAICAYQQLGPRLVDSQKTLFQDWAEEYRGDLGIALSDTLGFEKFLDDFDMYFAKLFDGARHDSGDPIEWGKDLVEHYQDLRIKPNTKTAVFSDGLDFPEIERIFRYFRHRYGSVGSIKTSFGIGTKLTNDVGYTAPQIVIKLVECNGRPVAKISDDPGKGMCEDPGFAKYLQEAVRREH